jgi:gliding motility-associated-like protein
MFILNNKIKKSIILKTLILFSFLLFNSSSRASHMIGGYMSYEYINVLPNGNLRYLVKYHIFRDCINGINLSNNLKLAVYYNSGEKRLNFVQNVSLVSKRIVNPPGSIECAFYRDRICVEYGVYQAFIDLEESNTGYILLYQECCRNIQTNLMNSDNQGQVYTAQIPNTQLRNSSPQFSGIPSPFMCATDTTDFSFSAYDKDGDVLSYKFVRPYRGNSSPNNSVPNPEIRFPNNIQEVQYSPGYNENIPFGITGYQTINSLNGMTNFMSPNSGSYVVAVEVTEKRNGVTLSKIRMDLQILVYNCPNNNKPILSNLTDIDKKYYEITSGEQLCIDIESKDPDNNIVFLNAHGEPLGDNSFSGTRASFSDTFGNGRIVSRFCWTPDCNHYREEPYILKFLSTDNGCPSKLSVMFIDIKVNKFIGAKDFIGPDKACSLDTSVYNLVYTNTESLTEWELLSGGEIIEKNKHSIKIRWNSSGNHIIRAREISPNGNCEGDWIERVIKISSNNNTPIIIGKDTACINVDISYSLNSSIDSLVNWSVSKNGLIKDINREKITINWVEPSDSSFVRVFTTDTNGCISENVFILVYISDPNPIIKGPLSVCPNSIGVEYQTDNNSGSVFDWSVIGGQMVGDTNRESVYINWGDSGIASLGVQEKNRFGCISPINRLTITKTYNLSKLEIFGDRIVCDTNSQYLYSVNKTNGSFYQWDILGGQQTSGDSSSEISVKWSNISGVSRIGVRQIALDMVSGKSCISPVSNLDIVIGSKPTADSIIGLLEICQFSDTSIYRIDGLYNSKYTWSINGDTQNIINQGKSEIKIFWNKPGIFNIGVVETSEFGCVGDFINISVLVHPKPKTTEIVGEFIICPEDAIKEYSVIGFNNSEFFWWVNNGNINSIDGLKNYVSVNWDINKTSGEIKVVEISEFGCIGDTQYAKIEIDILKINMRYVSVGTPDNYIEIYWDIPNLSSVNNFEIWKHVYGNSWNILRVVDRETRSFFETNINTDISPYSYKVISKNKCGNIVETFIHTNINLKLNEINSNKFSLKFTPYMGWRSGVYKYELWEKKNHENYQVINSSVLPNNYINLERLEQSFKQCYRILAYKNSDVVEMSWSNEQCITFSPLVYIPNAFTPNGDVNNDEFKPIVFGVYSYQLSIFNRWGEMLFSTTDTKKGWDGNYRGIPSPQGTYIYSLVYSDNLGKVYKTKGTINLIR